MELHELTALELSRALRSGEVGPVEAARHFLERIDRLNPRYGAFATVTPELALERASHVEAHVPRDTVLWGMPFGDKDLNDRAGVASGYGSRWSAGYVPEVSDELVRAMDAAGAVSLGKTAVPEFGQPSYTETRVGPPARDPWDPARGAGGSSGGAAAAVAAGMLPFAPGSDGGGSVRIPAASCGLVGVKPSRGRVPGGSGQASPGGLVVAGPLAHTVADAALLLDGMIGRAPRHPYALRAPGSDGPYLHVALGGGSGRLVVGVDTTSPWDDFTEIRLQPEARAGLDAAVATFAGAGHELGEVPAGPEPGYPDAFVALWQGGAAALPIDGERLELLEPLTRWLLSEGRAQPARRFAEALAWLAGFERRTIERFGPYDVVLTPALATLPPEVGSWDLEDGRENFAQQVRFTPYTSFVNVAGLPAITVPTAFTEAGHPVGVQLIGRPGAEATLFAAAAELEGRQGIAGRRAPAFAE